MKGVNAHTTSAGRGEGDAPKSGPVETGPTALVATTRHCYSEGSQERENSRQNYGYSNGLRNVFPNEPVVQESENQYPHFVCHK